jgi:hypothetical protein
MRGSWILRATRRVVKVNPEHALAGQLMPPLALYRSLLRSHRKRLDTEQRIVGDMYIKQEFRLHKNVENPAQVIQFLSSWQKYLEQLEGDSWKRETLDMTKINSMSDEQIIQVSLRMY